MARKVPGHVTATGKTILLVDDDLEYLEANAVLLGRQGHQVLRASSGEQALELVRKNHVDLLLLDYFMPGMTGEETVEKLREFNRFVQVILQTGYASEQPPRDLLQRLDIQGYYDKTEGPEKLLLWVDVGLKAAYTVQLLHRSRQGLRYILDVTPELHKLQPLADLLQGVLLQVSGLIGAVNSFIAVLPDKAVPTAPEDSFIAVLEGDTELVIRACTGHFQRAGRVDDALEPARLGLVKDVLQKTQLQTLGDATVVPLRVGEVSIGVIYLDRAMLSERDAELLEVFANQVAVAIHNTQLYEMATLDPLTGVYVRGFFEQYLIRTLRTVFRSREPLSLLMMDMDGLKQINDSAGHQTGDRALARIGQVLRDATRGTDLVGRYGGDEFVVLLPHTRADDAQRVADRVFSFLQQSRVESPSGTLRLAASLGLAEITPHGFDANELPRPIPQTYFQEMAQALVKQADLALYDAKRSGRGRLCIGTPLSWPRPVAGAAAAVSVKQ